MAHEFKISFYAVTFYVVTSIALSAYQALSNRKNTEERGYLYLMREGNDYGTLALIYLTRIYRLNNLFLLRSWMLCFIISHIF